MNKNAIKKFAIEARQKLIASVTDKAGMLGITPDHCSGAVTKGTDFEVYQTAAGTEVTLNKKQCEQRRKLADRIHAKGFEAVVEEVAYTWFNRICAIRFMEVNDYMYPVRVRVLSSEKEGKNEPDIVTIAPDIGWNFTDEEREDIIDAKMNNRLDDLFRMLFIKQCNLLHEVLPELFEETEDYTELLLNISFTDKESIVQMLVNSDTGIPEGDFNVKKSGQVEIIGWLYQYYNEERKNEVINIYKGTVKKEDIPAATQLFTTDWVVRYMVDNSLGRYWIERNPNSKLREKLEFFVMPKNGNIEYIDEKIDPTELTFLDPCMGSGHILVYAFDVFMEIYRECGYSDRDAALNIVQDNLFGLDIDDRAYQLAYFAVMMKARNYNRRALTAGMHNNLCTIQESNEIEKFSCDGLTQDSNMNIIGEYLVRAFKDAKEIGSLQSVDENDYKLFSEYLLNIELDGQLDFVKSNWIQKIQPKCLLLARQANILAKKYNVVATNPPYLGKMQGQLKKFAVDNYKDYAGDLFAIFMYRNFNFCVRGGYSAFMTPMVWMFIKTYENLRDFIIHNKSIITLVQMEYSAFEEATVPICSFVLKNGNAVEKALCFRLSDFKGGMEIQKQKVLEAIGNSNCGYFYEAEQFEFSKIPGLPVAYWASNNFIKAFDNDYISKYATSNGQNITGNNNKYLRLFWEVDYNNINKEYWVKCARGGGYRKYYGNDDNVILWTSKARQHYKQDSIARIVPEYLRFKSGITWSYITSGPPSFRKLWENELFEKAGTSIFINNINYINGILGLLNSNVSRALLKLISPTINYQIRDIFFIPVKKNVLTNVQINNLVEQNIDLEKKEWDSFETSWDFTQHPLIRYSSFSMEEMQKDKKNHIYDMNYIKEAYTNWENECFIRFNQLKSNEEELNRIFIDIYGLQDELTPDVEDKDVTVRKADLQRDIKSFISYAVGCMFGRYSLDEEGLVLAGQPFESHFIESSAPRCGTGFAGAPGFSVPTGEFYYKTDDGVKKCTYNPDKDNVIPITDEEYFPDDIVVRFAEFVKIVYGADTLEENLDFIAKALGNKGDTSREVIRNYFLKDFYPDHLKIYQKRPIYWMFDSGKENGFKALIYMHRYTPDTVGIVRTDYLHKTQKAIEQAMQRAQYTSENTSNAADKKKSVQQIAKYAKQLAQMKSYDEAMAHIANQRIEIDLDDGVKVNYAKFQGVEVTQEGKKALKIDLLAKIK